MRLLTIIKMLMSYFPKKKKKADELVTFIFTFDLKMGKINAGFTSFNQHVTLSIHA